MQRTPQTLLQLKCATCGTGNADCLDCKRKKLQRKADNQGGGGFASAAATDSLLTQNRPDYLPELQSRSGQGLAYSLRQKMESGFGHGFNQVRIHNDSRSHSAAKELGAHAFTLGQNIYFANGQYQPETPQGLRLLAHEMAHTVQQRGLPGTTTIPARASDVTVAANELSGANAFAIDGPQAPLEREADAAAEAVLTGKRPTLVVGGAQNAVQAMRVQALLQRQATPALSAGNATATRVINPHERVVITRTLQNRPCQTHDTPESTPSDRVFEHDENANALRFRYTVCNGRIRLSTGGEIDYSRLEDFSDRLVQGLNQVGLDQSARALDDAISGTTLTGRAEIVLNFDGVLEAGVVSEGTAGTTAQDVNVTGRLIISPGGGVRVALDGGVALSRGAAGDQTQYRIRGRVGTDDFSLSVEYRHIDVTPGVGPTASRDEVEATAGFRLPRSLPVVGGSVVGLGVLTDLGGNTTPLVTFGGEIGTPAPPRRVRCMECICPPPLPIYDCQRTVDTHEVPVEDRAQGTQIFRLRHLLDQTTPADATEFTAQVTSIAGLLANQSHVQRLDGFASPEARVAYNLQLSQNRADYSQQRIQQALTALGSTATVPAGIGRGELLGASTSHSGEARNSELNRELAPRLQAMSDEERLDFLGVDGARRSDPIQRQATLDDIQAFIDGRVGTAALEGRARWERIFPHLRRTEVEVNVHQITHNETRGDGQPHAEGCSQEDLDYAIGHMPAIPAGLRRPGEQCS